MFAAAGGSFVCGCTSRDGSGARNGSGTRLVVLAFDGLDPRLVRQLMDEECMPNMQSLAERGSFTTIATSTPPQTPVAFANIISGTDPGVHGIFDFSVGGDYRDGQVGVALGNFLDQVQAIAVW